MRDSGNDLLGRLAGELAALAASLVPLAAVSRAVVTLLPALRAQGTAYRFLGEPNPLGARTPLRQGLPGFGGAARPFGQPARRRVLQSFRLMSHDRASCRASTGYQFETGRPTRRCSPCALGRCILNVAAQRTRCPLPVPSHPLHARSVRSRLRHASGYGPTVAAARKMASDDPRLAAALLARAILARRAELTSDLDDEWFARATETVR